VSAAKKDLVVALDMIMKDLPPILLFTFAIGAMCSMTAMALKKQRFFHMLFRRFYVEASPNDDVYITSFTATCPWCGTKMNLRNVGPAKGRRNDVFVCERNPEQHTISLDPTILTDLNS